MIANSYYPPTSGVNATGQPIAISAGKYKGPYLNNLNGTNGLGNILSNPFEISPGWSPATNHWTYSNGTVKPAIPTTGTTLDGVPYQSL